MKNFTYESPTVEVVEVRVESGFANSREYMMNGISDYSTFEAGEMQEWEY